MYNNAVVFRFENAITENPHQFVDKSWNQFKLFSRWINHEYQCMNVIIIKGREFNWFCSSYNDNFKANVSFLASAGSSNDSLIVLDDIKIKITSNLSKAFTEQQEPQAEVQEKVSSKFDTLFKFTMIFQTIYRMAIGRRFRRYLKEKTKRWKTVQFRSLPNFVPLIQKKDLALKNGRDSFTIRAPNLANLSSSEAARET